ncbi:hypothetical protein T4C_10666 [Trichinella pseudospiralis]|uniref:Uncharacterized protein n=1 Tax=Trichinella pseudospiralis TaxID=6337 RepID=A0A0V1K2T0_TRIPS|nr:hypothetical protein T4C_10666 [Trichinella pseudospiralis]
MFEESSSTCLPQCIHCGMESKLTAKNFCCDKFPLDSFLVELALQLEFLNRHWIKMSASLKDRKLSDC